MNEIEFIYHDSLNKEIATLERRFHSIRDSFYKFEKLCKEQFNPINPRQVISPGKLHRIAQNGICTIWKIELAVLGLRPNQFPRVWFAIEGLTIAFLCIASHIDNYDDNSMEKIASTRVTDIF